MLSVKKERQSDTRKLECVTDFEIQKKTFLMGKGARERFKNF